MKEKLICILIVILFSSKINSQEIALSVDSSGREMYPNRYQYFDINQFEQRTVLKIAFFAGDQRDISVPFFNMASIEHKLSESISLEGLFYSGNEKYVSAKIRYYLNKGKKNDINNISGNYFAVEFAKSVGKPNSLIREFSSYLGLNNTLMLQYGKQLKSGKFGFADFRIYANRQTDFSRNYINVGFNTLVGAAWGHTELPDYTENEDYSENIGNNSKLMFSIQNLNMTFGKNFNSFTLSSGLEAFLFSGFTLRTVIKGDFAKQSAKAIDAEIETKSIGISGELRKYIFLNAQIKKGKMPSSFSGAYGTFGADNILSKANLDLQNISSADDLKKNYSHSGVSKITPYFGLGYQERAGKRFFFDVNGRYYHFTKNEITNEKGPHAFTIRAAIGLYWAR